MNMLSKLFHDSHATLEPDHLISFSTVIQRPQVMEELKQTVPNLSLELVHQTPKILDVHTDDLYILPGNIVSPYAYFKEDLFIGMMSLEPEALDVDRTAERICIMREKLREYREKENWGKYFGLVDKRIRIPSLKKRFLDIPHDQKVDIFLDVYTSCETGFEQFDKQFLEEVMEYRTHSPTWKERMTMLDEHVKEEEVIVYHGQNEDDHLRISWTLDPKVAQFFAQRFGQQGNIIQGIVKKTDIWDYIPWRNECEVLIDPDFVKIKEMIRRR